MINEKLGKRLAGSASKLRVKSALNPALWFCGIALPITFAAVSFLPADLPAWKIVLAFIPLSVPSIGFFYLLFFDRDKLQSEEYQIQKQSLEMIVQKGETPSIPHIVELAANPDAEAIIDGR